MSKVREIPWLRIGAESVAIVASILLAFGIDAWWSGRSEVIRTNELLQDLKSEWNSELDRMESALDQFASFRSAMAEVFSINQQDPELLTEEHALKLFADHRWSTYKPSTGALDIVLENGLNKINDSVLALAISSWHSVLLETAPEENALFSVTLGRLREARQDVAHRLNLPIVNTSDPSPLSLYGPEAGRAAKGILTDEEFLRVQRQILDIASDYESQLRETQQILAGNVSRLQGYLEN
jgi:hypothetical protein